MVSRYRYGAMCLKFPVSLIPCKKKSSCNKNLHHVYQVSYELSNGMDSQLKMMHQSCCLQCAGVSMSCKPASLVHSLPLNQSDDSSVVDITIGTKFNANYSSQLDTYTTYIGENIKNNTIMIV